MTEYRVFRAVETWERVSVFLCMPSAQLCLKVCSVFLPNSVSNPCLFDVSKCLQECELWAVNATSNGLVVVEVETEPCPPHAKAIYRAVTPCNTIIFVGKSWKITHLLTHLPACVIMQFFSPKQFTVGVLNSFLKSVRLFPGGGVRLSGCLLIHLSLSLVHGVRLFRCLPIHLSPLFGWWCLALRMSPNGNSFVSQCGQCCSALWMYHFYLFPFICLPLCLVVSGSSDVFSLFQWSLIRYLSPCVSQFICLPINLSRISGLP